MKATQQQLLEEYQLLLFEVEQTRVRLKASIKLAEGLQPVQQAEWFERRMKEAFADLTAKLRASQGRMDELGLPPYRSPDETAP